MGTQSKERADEVDKLNGDRTKIAKQQRGRMAEDFPWSEDFARQYLNATVMTEYQQQNGSSADGFMCRSPPKNAENPNPEPWGAGSRYAIPWLLQSCDTYR